MLFGVPVSDVANYSIIATAIAAFVTFGLHFYQVKAQSKAADLENLYKVMGEISNGWEKLTLCDQKHWDFYFGQLLSSYELACYLANRKIIGKTAQEPLTHQIIEVVVFLLKDEELLEKIRDLISSDHTFEEIIKFIKTHNNKFKDQWNYIKDSGLSVE